MVIKLTDEAKDKLNELLQEKQAGKALRIYMAGYG